MIWQATLISFALVAVSARRSHRNRHLNQVDWQINLDTVNTWDMVELNMAPGQEKILSLEENLSTGYGWEMINLSNGVFSVEDLGQAESVSGNPTFVGAPGLGFCWAAGERRCALLRECSLGIYKRFRVQSFTLFFMLQQSYMKIWCIVML